MNTIDYELLAKAVKLYAKFGFKFIEVPWRVSTSISNVTRPTEAKHDYEIKDTNKSLIASGEQGFMYLMNKGSLAPGLYQTITPCFRNESYDITHSKQFMKLELINVLWSPVDRSHNHQLLVNEFAMRAESVFGQLCPEMKSSLELMTLPPTDPLLLPGTNQLDLEVVLQTGKRRIELGSYGARRAEFGSWIYGTGLAEPRFSKTANLFL